MMSYDKSERGRQHQNSGHQRITYKKIYNTNTNNNKNKNNTYPTAYPKYSMGRGRPCRSNSFAESSPNDWLCWKKQNDCDDDNDDINNNGKRKMFLDISNEIIKCKSLTKKEEKNIREDTHASHTTHRQKP